MSSTKDSTFCMAKNVVMDHVDAKSVHSQCTTTTDTSSVVSNEDSTVASQAVEHYHDHQEDDEAPPPHGGRPSALKCSKNGPRRLRADVRIKFSCTVQQQRHLALHEYTAKELDACWFRKSETADIAHSCCMEINMLEQGNLSNPSRHCSRGLESHTRLAVLAKQRNRIAAKDAVFDEQRNQFSLGLMDDEAIARRYLDASSSCKLWAIHLGQQDQRAAELVYDTMLD